MGDLQKNIWNHCAVFHANRLFDAWLKTPAQKILDRVFVGSIIHYVAPQQIY